MTDALEQRKERMEQAMADEMEKKGFTVRDKREERRIAEEAEAREHDLGDPDHMEHHEEELTSAVDQASEEQVAAAIARGEQEEEAANKRRAARSQLVMGPILILECPHCRSVIKTIDEEAMTLYAEGKINDGPCINPECGQTFTVQRPLAPAVRRVPNPPKAVMDAVRRGALPGLPIGGR